MCVHLENRTSVGGIKDARGEVVGEQMEALCLRRAGLPAEPGGVLTLWRGASAREGAWEISIPSSCPSPCLSTASSCFHKGEDLFFNNAKLTKVASHHFLKCDFWGREIISDLLPGWTCVRTRVVFGPGQADAGSNLGLLAPASGKEPPWTLSTSCFQAPETHW